MSYSKFEKFTFSVPIIAGIFLAITIIDFDSLDIGKIVVLVVLLGFWYLFLWAKIKDEKSKKGKKKPRTYAEEEEQEQQESLDRLKNHLEDKDRKERKKEFGL